MFGAQGCAAGRDLYLVDAGEAAKMTTPQHVANILVDIASKLLGDDDVVGLLHSASEHAVNLTGASAAAILLADSNRQLQYMVSTTQRAEILEGVMSGDDEGPYQKCFQTGAPIVAVHLKEGGSHWAKFGLRAAAVGYDAIHALPLRFRSEQVGALTLLYVQSESLNPQNARIVQALADILTISVLGRRRVQQAHDLNNQLEIALTSRVIIEQAKGAFAQRMGITVDEAFHLLRRYARHHQLRLAVLCEEIISTPALIKTIAAFAKPSK